jgi:pyruvate/2-oxoacid:ferredoxin oxidoreductase beta subunit
MSDAVANPTTGEVLETEDDFRAAIRAVEERMWPLFIQRNELQSEYARRFPLADMPTRRRHRTETQERVVRCPRCGSGIE